MFKSGLKNVTIIGAGTMGTGIAQIAAVKGHTVYLNDRSKDALKKATSTLQRSLKQDLAVRKMKPNDAKDFISKTIRWV